MGYEPSVRRYIRLNWKLYQITEGSRISARHSNLCFSMLKEPITPRPEDQLQSVAGLIITLASRDGSLICHFKSAAEFTGASTVSTNAMIAQLEAATEIHWLWP